MKRAAYTPAEHAEDKEKILAALDAVIALREAYKDVIAIPEIVVLHDITEYRLDTPRGPLPFKKFYSRDVAVSILRQFNENNYVTPEELEMTIVVGLEEHKKLSDTSHKD